MTGKQVAETALFATNYNNIKVVIKIIFQYTIIPGISRIRRLLQLNILYLLQ